MWISILYGFMIIKWGSKANSKEFKDLVLDQYINIVAFYFHLKSFYSIHGG